MRRREGESGWRSQAVQRAGCRGEPGWLRLRGRGGGTPRWGAVEKAVSRSADQALEEEQEQQRAAVAPCTEPVPRYHAPCLPLPRR